MRAALSESEGSATAMSLLSLGYAAAAAGEQREALRNFEEAHSLYWALHKPDVTTMVELSRLEVQGALEDAQTLGEQLTSDVPAPTQALDIGFIKAMLLRNRARILHRAGASETALSLLEESLAIAEIDPEHQAHTYMVQADVLADLGELDLALVTIEDALEQLDQETEGEAGLRAVRLELLLDAGEIAEAQRELELLERLRGAYPSDSPPQEALSRLRARLKSLSTAGKVRQ